KKHLDLDLLLVRGQEGGSNPRLTGIYAVVHVHQEPAAVIPSRRFRSGPFGGCHLATTMLQGCTGPTQFSSCSHQALISERFSSPSLTGVCQKCRNQHMGETTCQRRVLPLTPSCTCASSCGYHRMPCWP